MTPRKVVPSPQSRAARQHSAMAKQQERGLILRPNFLLTCSDDTLASHELALLAECADISAQVQELLHRWNDTTAQVSVVKWFRRTDRQALKHAIENEESPIEWAQRKIREDQRSEEELIPLPALESGATHLAAALRYQQRNLEEGKCISCPEPLAPNSATFCEKHLRAKRLRYKPKNAKGALPGSVGWLHGEGFESQHGRMPGTVQSLANARQKKNRAILASLGLPLGSVATALEAAKEKLLEHIPENKAITAVDLLNVAHLSGMRSTARKALHELVAAGQIQHTKRKGRNKPLLYFRGGK